MPMSRLRTDRQTDGNVKVEQYSAEAESAKTCSHYYERSFFVIVHKRCKISLRSLRNNVFVWFERQESPQWARSHRLTAQVLL